MIYSKGSKIIAAILTAALALSPVFMTPSSAFEGQDVEIFADSWRYSEGEIICEEEPEEELQAESAEAEADVDAKAVTEVDPEELTEEEAEEQIVNGFLK